MLRITRNTRNLSIMMNVAFVVLIILIFSTPVLCQDNPKEGKEKIVLTLQQCIEKAIEISPEIGEVRYEEDIYKSKKLQADSSAYPQIELIAVTGPSPRARGDQVSSPDDITRPTINGIFGSADVLLIQPIYSFGKLRNLQEAASSGINAAKAATDKKTSDIILRIKELYYSLLLARDMKNLALEIRDELTDSIEKLEKQLEQGSPWAEEVQLYKLKAFLGEVEKKLNETEKGISLAREALMAHLDLPQGTDFDIEDNSLTPEDRSPVNLDNYIYNALESRPEFIQLQEGLQAKNALVEAEKSNYYPTFFIGLSATIAGATNRTRITNPFIYDVFSRTYGAAFLGVKWSIDFGITKGKVQEAEAEYHKLLEKKRFADSAIPLEVKKVFFELREASESIPETETGYKNAKKWLVAAVANFDLGLGEAKEIADAAVVYAQLKADYLRSLYNQRIAFANLSYATGTDLKEIQ
jgi:outer membrane protein